MAKKREKEINPVKGILSEDIVDELHNIETPEEKENRYYRMLKQYVKEKELLVGTVFSVETFGDHAVIGILWNDIKVTIPDTAYFEPEFDFGKSYATWDKEEQLERRVKCAKYQLGAKVYFIPLHVERNREKINGKKETLITVIASRVAAMEVLRDIFFWHKKRKDSELAPRSIHEGDITTANVLSVKEENALVELCGIETRIGRRDITNKGYFINCHDCVSPGDTIKVRVKKIYINQNKIHLSVTARLGDSSKLIHTMKPGGSYVGVVIDINAPKKSYLVMLSNGVIMAIHFDRVADYESLDVGDNVQAYVHAIYDEFAVGSARRIKN